ncbi:MAG: hypothetical protein ACREEE_13425, partial [Dongiaceae bacterium]
MWQVLGRKLGKDYRVMLRLLSLAAFQHEGQRHEQLRKTMARAIAPFAGLNEIFAKRINKMLGQLDGSDGFDLADDFANHILSQLFCDLMEIPEADRGEVRPMSRMTRILEPTLSIKDRDEAIGAISMGVDYLTRHAHQQIETGRPCLIGSIYRELPADEPDKFGATASIAAIMSIMG